MGITIEKISGSFSIGGKNIKGASNVVIGDDGKMTIDGVPLEDYQEGDGPMVVKIVITGNVGNIKTENADVEVNGKVCSINSKNGNITCGEVAGNVESKNGNITCGSVKGDVYTKNGCITRNNYFGNVGR